MSACITNNSIRSFVYMVKLSKISIWTLDKILPCATTLGQSGPGSHGNEGVLPIPQSSRAGALPSDGLMSYPGHSLGGSCPSAGAVSVFYIPRRLDWSFGGKEWQNLSSISLLCFIYRLRCIIGEECYKIYLPSKLQWVFRRDLQLFCF